MRIRMNTLSAAPTGVRLAGREYEVPDAEARQLLAGGYAVAVNPAPATTESGTGRENTAKPPAANAAGVNTPQGRPGRPGRARGKKS